MIGIYKITNLINNKMYIGQSVNIENRWDQHKHGKGSRLLFAAFNKYGIENFTFEVIEECDKETLDQRENYWIQYYDSTIMGYNLSLNMGFEHKYDIDKIYKTYQKVKSIKQTSLITGCHAFTIRKLIDKYSWEQYYPTPVVRRILQFDENNNLIHIHNSVAEAARSVGALRSSIIAVLKHKHVFAHGYKWSYEGEESQLLPTNSKWDSLRKPIIQLDKKTNKEIARYKSLTLACHGISVNPKYGAGHISQACHGERKSAYGYKWRYEE